MNAIKVRKRFEVNGRDEQELVRQIDAFRQALRTRSGSIVDIKRASKGPGSPISATIVYRVPLGTDDLGMSAS